MMEQEQIIKEESIVETPAQDTTSEVENSPEVQAALYLRGALPAFRRKLETVTGVQAKHVLSALMEAPLEKETPGFTTKDAEELFMMGLTISNAKFILFNVALKDQKIASETEKQAQEAGAAEAQKSEGESNG